MRDDDTDLPADGRTGVLVVGDAMLDVVTVADPPEELTIAALDYRDAVTELHAGGTGVNLAAGAVAAGFDPVRLLCGLGCAGTPGAPGVPDHAAAIVLDEMARAGVSVVANFSSDAPTGTAVVAYVGGGRRLMFGSPGANRAGLSPEAARRARDALRDVGVLLVSGWALFRPATAHGIVALMSAARERGVRVVLDVVPHTVHTRMTLPEFRRVTEAVTHVSGNAGTFAGLYGGDDPGLLLDDFTGALVRERDGSYTVAHRSRGRLRLPAPASDTDADLRGSTDRFLVGAIRDHFVDGVFADGVSDRREDDPGAGPGAGPAEAGPAGGAPGDGRRGSRVRSRDRGAAGRT